MGRAAPGAPSTLSGRGASHSWFLVRNLEAMDVFTAGEVRARTGLSYRQVDDLARKGVLGPSVASAAGRGTRRLYSERDVALLRAVALMRKAGIGRTAFEAAMKFLRTSAITRSTRGRFMVIARGRATIMDASRLTQFLSEPSTLTVVLPLTLLEASGT